jgi:Transglycosylase SLT domain
MKSFFSGQRPGKPDRIDMLEELERLARGARALPLVAPFLLLVGFGAGEMAKRALTLPDSAVAESTIAAVPGGHLDALDAQVSSVKEDGERTVRVMTKYRDDIAPIEKVLRNHGVSRSDAKKISWALVDHANSKGLDQATVISILLVESGGKPNARSPVGARGLMQVMPGWAGRWRGCGRDLYDVEDNLCNGTSILRWYIQTHGDERRALLGYNGCVRGTNTPNCFIYPNKIWTLRDQIKRELDHERSKLRRRAGD